MFGLSLPTGGDLLSYIGGRQANDANKDIAHNANAMSQANAREQMAFQERMSNTTHAREVADLKAAGLNPILSVNAGAPAPAGASGATTTGAPQSNALAGLAASAREAKALELAEKKNAKELDLMEAQTKKTNVDAAVATRGIPAADLTNKIYDKIREGMSSGSKMLENIKRDFNNKGSDRSFENKINNEPSYKLKRAR